MPGYRAKMGFGLHVGWAVEGAIGYVGLLFAFYCIRPVFHVSVCLDRSPKKIDATYISPHVNMSEFLEGETKTYGT